MILLWEFKKSNISQTGYTGIFKNIFTNYSIKNIPEKILHFLIILRLEFSFNTS